MFKFSFVPEEPDVSELPAIAFAKFIKPEIEKKHKLYLESGSWVFNIIKNTFYI